MNRIYVCLLALLMGGCVLQSKAPLFGEKDSVMLFKNYGTRFSNYGLDGDTWKKEDKPMIFVAVNQHYEARNDDGSTIVAAFIPLQGNWYVAQYHEAKGQTAYGLIETEKDALYLHPIACKTLKKMVPKPKKISFVKDDCFAAARMKATDFGTLIPAAGKRELKLVPEK